MTFIIEVVDMDLLGINEVLDFKVADAFVGEMALGLVKGTIVIGVMAGWKRVWWWHGGKWFQMASSLELLECFGQ